MNAPATNIIIIGAGPYGLAAAAHLRNAGHSVRVFGSLMSFWKDHMPKGMMLKSSWGASRIADPRGAYTLDEFERVRGTAVGRPVPLTDFIAYAEWFQQRAVPDIDPRTVTRVDPADGGFRVLLEDGEAIACDRVVVAAGIAPFAWRPPEFDGLPVELASHSSEHQDLGHFAGRRVAVIGAGQSGLESAVLLHESGADVEMIVRAPHVRWVGRTPRQSFVGRILYDRTDVGPAFISHVVARPTLLRLLPASLQREAGRRSIAPGGAHWLSSRADRLRISPGQRVAQAVRSGDDLRLTLADGTTREVDHVLLATGYRVDVTRYSFLPAPLLARLRCSNGHPVLDRGLQSSLPGLHFVGAPAMGSFGPLLRFVSGTAFAGSALARGIARSSLTGAGRARAVSPTERVTLSGSPDERTAA
jgi:pyridine nucleotide-disulfide oxidoreductase